MGPNPTVVYDQPGTYQVAVYITEEADQRAQVTKTVVVPESSDGFCEAWRSSGARAAPA